MPWIRSSTKRRRKTMRRWSSCGGRSRPPSVLVPREIAPHPPFGHLLPIAVRLRQGEGYLRGWLSPDPQWCGAREILSSGGAREILNWVAFSLSQPHRDGEKVPQADEGRSREA